MLATNQQNESPSLDSSHALALESASSAFAVQLLSATGSCTAAGVAYEAMQAIVTRAFRMAARDWNDTHDRMRVLPPELRCVCWSYLSPSDMLRIPRVCRSWRELSRSTPLLWTNLKLSGSRGDLDDIFALSVDLPFHLDIRDCLPADAYRVNQCLSGHAARIQSLCISLTADVRFDNPDADLLFLYPVPGLHGLTMQTSRKMGDWGIPASLFNGHAPSLRSVTLSNVALPGSCAAFSQLTHLRIENNCGPLDSIYAIAPRMEELALVNVNVPGNLPPVPADSRLSKVSFLFRELPFSVLLSRGYVTLPQLLVSVQYSTFTLHASARDCPSAYRGTLTITDSGRTALVLRHERGSTASFIATDPSRAEVRSLLSGSAQFHTLEHLVLPAELNASSVEDANGGRSCAPYIPADGLVFPALRTLTLLCAPRGRCSLLDPDTECGNLMAPLLARIELSRDPQAANAGAVTVDPCQLALFIAEHVSCNASAALEVRVDRAAEGVCLECTHQDGGLDRLRACIGNLVLSDEFE